MLLNEGSYRTPGIINEHLCLEEIFTYGLMDTHSNSESICKAVHMCTRAHTHIHTQQWFYLGQELYRGHLFLSLGPFIHLELSIIYSK